jgi:hypothetical protein
MPNPPCFGWCIGDIRLASARVLVGNPVRRTGKIAVDQAVFDQEYAGGAMVVPPVILIPI